jgi:probable HAF family extracellular repeat protein
MNPRDLTPSCTDCAIAEDCKRIEADSGATRHEGSDAGQRVAVRRVMLFAIRKSARHRAHARCTARLVLASVATTTFELGDCRIRGRKRWGLATKLLLAGALWLFAPIATSAASAATMTGLGALGGAGSEGAAINDLGQVTGVASLPDRYREGVHAFRWTASGGMQDLGTLGGTDSSGAAINVLGQVTGKADTADGTSHAFRWTPSGGMQDLGTLGGPYSEGVAINALGQVTGDAWTADGRVHAFRWTPSGGMQDLGTLGGTHSSGSSINAMGQVTGSAETTLLDPSGVPIPHAFRWTPSGGMQDLGTLPGAPYSFGVAINDLGQVTGDVAFAKNEFAAEEAFRWSPVP